MTSQDVLNIALSVGFLVGIGFFAYAIMAVVDTLRTLKLVMEDVKDTTSDITSLKESVKFGAFSILAKLLAGTKKTLAR